MVVKNKLTFIATLLAVQSILMGEIEVNNYLSIKGFVDMSYVHYDEEINPVGGSQNNDKENLFRIDEIEVSWLFKFESLSAQLDIEYEEDGDDLEIEQAFAIFSFDSELEGSAITAGRYASMLGFEAYEPTGLYQYSTAYGGNALNNLLASAVNQSVTHMSSFDTKVPVFFEAALFPISERYSQGIKYTYDKNGNFLGISIQDSTVNYENRFGGKNDSDSTPIDDGGYSVEVAYTYSLGYELKLFLGGAYESGNGLNTPGNTTGYSEAYMLNTYLTLELGALLFAAEFNFSETNVDEVSILSSLDTQIESIGGFFMTNYVYHETASLTGRISYVGLENTVEGSSGNSFSADVFKYTLAHNYALKENFLLITELSYTEGEFKAADADGNVDELLVAAEILVTF